MTEIDNARRIADLNLRIDKIKQRKIEAAKETELLQKQYQDQVAELKNLGVDNVENLDEVITDLERQVEESLAQAERAVTEIESKLI